MPSPRWISVGYLAGTVQPSFCCNGLCAARCNSLCCAPASWTDEWVCICVCVCVCACTCFCVWEGEIYLSSTRGSIRGVCALGKRLSLWLFSWYELQSLSPADPPFFSFIAHSAPRISPALYSSLPNPDVSAMVQLTYMMLCCYSASSRIAWVFVFQHNHS